MKVLPAAVSQVAVPSLVTPTALATACGCGLRMVLSSSRNSLGRLPSGPEAAIGTLVHRVLEAWGKAADDVVDPAELFESEYNRLRMELSADPDRCHFADLSSTTSLAEWSWVRDQALSRCTARKHGQPRRTRHARSSGATRSTGTEVPLESHVLRLRGQADRVESDGPDQFVIRDYKTGSAVGSTGEVRPEYVLQLRCYGLMMLEVHPRAQVRLVVDDGIEREVTFDADSRKAALEFVQSSLGGLPAAGLAEARPLAQPGAACDGCAFRFVCPAYRETAPQWWHRYPEDLVYVPLDTWGTVTGVAVDGSTSVVLEDDAGRRVHVDRLDARHGVDAFRVGGRIWVFNLAATGPARGFDGQRYHPRGFHELPRDLRERRAWAVVVFREA